MISLESEPWPDGKSQSCNMDMMGSNIGNNFSTWGKATCIYPPETPSQSHALGRPFMLYD